MMNRHNLSVDLHYFLQECPTLKISSKQLGMFDTDLTTQRTIPMDSLLWGKGIKDGALNL